GEVRRSRRKRGGTPPHRLVRKITAATTPAIVHTRSPFPGRGRSHVLCREGEHRQHDAATHQHGHVERPRPCRDAVGRPPGNRPDEPERHQLHSEHHTTHPGTEHERGHHRQHDPGQGHPHRRTPPSPDGAGRGGRGSAHRLRAYRRERGGVTTAAPPDRVLVVGAGLAGLRTVAELRAAGYTGHLELIGAEVHPPYDRPPLSKELLTRPDPVWLAEDLGHDLAALADEVHLGVRATALHPGP